MAGDTSKKPGRASHSYHSAWMANTRRNLGGGCAAGQYLTKLRLTKNVKNLITMFFRSNEWKETGPGWEGVVNTLRLDPDTAYHRAAPGTHG